MAKTKTTKTTKLKKLFGATAYSEATTRNYEGAPDTGRPWMEEACTKHVNRGGGWGNHARTARVSTRDGDVHGAHSDGLGFRVARSIVYANPLPAAAAKPAAPAAPQP